MPVSIKFNGEIVEVVMSGRVVGAEMLSQIGEMIEIEAREAVTPNRLVDLREVDTAEIKFNDVYAIAERRRHEKLKNPIKSAFLVKANVQYGIARTFQTINDNPQITIQIFRDEAEARTWLAEATGGCKAQ